MRSPWRDRQGQISGLKVSALCACALPGAWMLLDWRTGAYGPIPVIGFVYWSGIWATVALLAALTVSPLRSLLRRPSLIATRRIFGVSALLYALVHLVAFAMLFRWKPGDLAAQFMRPTIIVASFSLAILLLLGLTSNDTSIRRLGSERWNRLHSFVYVASVLAVAHFLLSPGVFGAQYLSLGVLAWLLLWRLRPEGSLGTGAVGAGLLTLAATGVAVSTEILWLWAYQDMHPFESVPLMIWDDDLAIWWLVLLFGAAMTAASFLRGAATRPDRSTDQSSAVGSSPQ